MGQRGPRRHLLAWKSGQMGREALEGWPREARVGWRVVREEVKVKVGGGADEGWRMAVVRVSVVAMVVGVWLLWLSRRDAQ